MIMESAIPKQGAAHVMLASRVPTAVIRCHHHLLLAPPQGVKSAVAMAIATLQQENASARQGSEVQTASVHLPLTLSVMDTANVSETSPKLAVSVMPMRMGTLPPRGRRRVLAQPIVSILPAPQI